MATLSSIIAGSYVGTQGPAGPQGATGAGAQGATGTQGATGIGAQGIQGILGPQGTTGTAPNAVQNNLTTTISVGYTITPYNAGNRTTGTYTPSPAQGNYQYYTNNGVHTIGAPTSDCAIDILMTNGSTPGSVTFTGFQVGISTGSALTTTVGHNFIISIRRINSISTYSIYALQ